MLPENLIEYGRKAEQAGYDELWVVEDLTFNGGISAAATVLATTERIKVGIGIMPAVARNPAYLAMDIATLARIHPGRLLPGLGHGVASWMQQVGAFPTSQLAALEETALAVRRLLRGETVTMNGKHVHIDSVKLLLPPDEVPPISLGVRATKSLTLAGRSADGTILTEGASPTYIRWARQQIEEGLRESGWQEPHRLTVFAHCSVDADGDAARARLRPVMANELANPGNRVLWEPTGLLPEIDEWLADSGEDRFARLPDAWLDQFAVVGTPEVCAAGIRRLVEAGATTVVLVPITGQNPDEIAQILKFV
jgi:alkanesulfonate monooxygenase SsuD/methylene tetrahydromethanopterin reductase-like flavin-dependent oxidoreductase (luciferase family)